ncbi:DUF4865 family protein [Actinomadura barringtoniae]|uniref:DUF4865 family protein n=1 Tax=Actinomadura barringtoniae TaxID=1427535 RepID=A0A939T9U0_9ACTN|nr:DUF4865 family protein [Actinomadura barringtoniae]MBO2454644.1 DUF4865 family protein [Actinomadura barringtoniae]
MYAMQYAFKLPADYDMQGLRERVSKAMHTLDERAGLAFKAYMFRDAGVDGSPVNEYACLYLWHDTTEMSRLLLTGDDRFQNIIRFFGRPAVQHWTGIDVVTGPARGVAPIHASRRVTTLPVYADDEDGMALSRAVERETEELKRLSVREGVHTAALAVDPSTWQLLRVVLWEHAVPADEQATERYEVMHVSTPSPYGTGLGGV